LDWAIQSHFRRPEELALARIPDSRALGGSLPLTIDNRQFPFQEGSRVAEAVR